MLLGHVSSRPPPKGGTPALPPTRGRWRDSSPPAQKKPHGCAEMGQVVTLSICKNCRRSAPLHRLSLSEIAMQSHRKRLCYGIGFLLAALLASPTTGQQPKPGAERGRDPAGAAPARGAEKTKPETDRNGTNPFAGKILVVEQSNTAFGQWMPIAMEKCEIIDVGHVQLLSG